MIDSPWDEDASPEATREAEWSKMSNEFTTVCVLMVSVTLSYTPLSRPAIEKA